MERPPFLSASRLTRSFGDRIVLADASFELHAGERAALTGANGAGKTTLLRILATLTLPTQGDAAIRGCSVVRDPRPTRALLGWAPATEGGFLARFSGRENLRFFGSLYGLSVDRVDEIICAWKDWEPFGAALETPFFLASAGMRQTLLLVRSILHGPDVLLWDEPFRSLDPAAAGFLKRKVETEFTGKTLIYSVHAGGDALALANSQLVLMEGKIRHVRAP